MEGTLILQDTGHSLYFTELSLSKEKSPHFKVNLLQPILLR